MALRINGWGNLADQTSAIGWYAASADAPVVTHWNGVAWDATVQRADLAPGTPIRINPSLAAPPHRPSQPIAAQIRPPRKKTEIGCGTGCMMVVLGMVIIGLLVSWISAPFAASNNPSFTKESGLATCKELVARQDNGSGNTTVMGSVLQGDRYKASLAVAGFSKAYRFTCRLEWIDGKWSTDILEYHQVFVP